MAGRAAGLRWRTTAMAGRCEAIGLADTLSLPDHRGVARPASVHPDDLDDVPRGRRGSARPAARPRRV